MPAQPSSLRIEPCDIAAVLALERELGVSHVLAQVLVRRGFGEPDDARAWLAAEERHEPSQFAGIEDACDLILMHVESGDRITIHGDYDVDGVTSTAILVGVLRELGADVDWFLPAARRTLRPVVATGSCSPPAAAPAITADCAIRPSRGAAGARRIDFVVTDHQAAPTRPARRAARAPSICGYRAADLCAACVAYSSAQRCSRRPAATRRAHTPDLIVALATIADCVRFCARTAASCARACARRTTTRPAARAKARARRSRPIDARPSASGCAAHQRAGRSSAPTRGSSCCDDDERAPSYRRRARPLNASAAHRDSDLFDAEAQVAQSAIGRYVLAGGDGTRASSGFVASRIAQRHHRPAVRIASTRDRPGTGRALDRRLRPARRPDAAADTSCATAAIAGPRL